MNKINIQVVKDALYGKWKKERLAGRELARDPKFQTPQGTPMDEHRARALEQLKGLVELKAVHRAFPKSLGGEDNHGGNVAAFHEMVFADPSMQIKSGVQWGLFGAAILHLGTKEHHDKWLKDVMSLEIPGAFAMTEIGHGSDVDSVQTTATYDREKEEFVIHTPHRAAWKEFLGNAALHGEAAVVFAQLIIENSEGQKVNHGVHAFFVPIRNKKGEMLPGIGSEDDGYKGGLNGIDNGRLHFTNVRIPRTNLLNRYGDVAVDGTYTSPIESPGRRFFTMLGTLVQGRVSLDGSAVNAMKGALAIAIGYGFERKQFAGSDGKEITLMDYGLHRRRLIPRLAETYAMAFASERLLHLFDGVFSGANDTPESREDLETLAAALKSLSTWAALDTLQEAREATGGAGFMAKNRLTSWRQDLDIYVTFEGDNNVLLQLVGKRLLKDYAEQFKNADAAVYARAAAGQVGERVQRFGLRQMGQSIADFGKVSRSVDSVRENQHNLLADRVETMITKIATALNSANKKGADAAQEEFNRQQHSIIQAAIAHAELLQWEAFTAEVNAIEDEDTKTVMTWVRDLFGMTLLERHIEWYLVNGRISGQRAEAITQYTDRLIDRVTEHAKDLIAAFDLDNDLLRADIASGIEAERQVEAAKYVADQKAKGLWPVHEKELRKKK